MKLLLPLFCFSIITTVAAAQQAPGIQKGTNPNPNAPVNVSDPAKRPANPEIKKAVPAKGGQVFYVKDDKPASRPRTDLPTHLLPKNEPAAPKQK